MEIRGQWSLVTGGAKRLGRGIALGLARAGANVVVHHGHSPREADETVREIRGLGVEAFAVAADLSDPDAIAGLFGRMEAQAGALSVLVNSAASFQRQSLMDADVEAWDSVLDLNLRAVWLCLKHGAELMRASAADPSEQGVVVNIADLTGVQAWPGYSHHAVSKAGVVHLSRIAARELAPGIRVNCVVPGAILPPPGMADDDPDWLEKVERLPVQRPGGTEVIADAILFLARNPFVTGEVLTVDGGEQLLGGQPVE